MIVDRATGMPGVASPDGWSSSAPQPPLRIAFLVDGFSVGGTELNAVRTAEAVDRSRYDLSVIGMSHTGPLRQRYVDAGIRVEDFWFRGLLHPDVLPMTRRLAAWLRRERIDVLHCHDKYSNMFGALAGRLARVPLLIVSRRFQDFEGRRFAIGNAVAFRLAHRVLANSSRVAGLLAHEGIDQRKTVVVSNFLDDAAFDPAGPEARAAFRRDLAIADDAIVVGTVARLDPIKDHETLLVAFGQVLQRAPRAVLVLVGDGPRRSALEERVRALGLTDAVRFAGWRSNRVNLHQWFDVSTLTSIAEGFPNAVIEAMAASVAVVATDVGAVRDAVIDGETGIVVPARDVAALASALTALVTDAQLRRALGEAGRARALAHYRRAAVLPSLYALWDEARAHVRGGVRRGPANSERAVGS